MDEDRKLIEVRRRVHAIKGFYIHLTIYLTIMTLLFVINLLTRSVDGVWWVQFPLLGWGTGIMIHALVVYGLSGWLGPDWEERKIQELMGKH